MRHAFGSGPAFRLGMEEELLLVDPGTLGLAHVASDLLGGLAAPEGTIKPDTYEALVELATPIVDDAGEGAAVLAALRARVAGPRAVPLGAGIHPAAAFGDVEHVPEARYDAVVDQVRGLLKRTPTCALHVHVGMPDPDTAIHVFNHLREWLALFQGLAANSPFWHGRDSGLASARAAMFRGLPRAIVPRAFADAGEWEETTRAVVRAGDAGDYTFMWWDLRLHPNLGTVELRAMDGQSSLDAVAGLSALVHGLALDAAERPALPRWTPWEVLHESSFRAARDGTAATIWHEDELRPVAEVARAALARARPHLAERGGEDALDGIERLLERGGGAGAQRAAHAERGMPGLLAFLAQDTSRTR